MDSSFQGIAPKYRLQLFLSHLFSSISSHIARDPLATQMYLLLRFVYVAQIHLAIFTLHPA